MSVITRMAVTINNPTAEDYQALRDICQISRYVVAADETAPTTGTPHIQAYVALKQEKKQRQSGWKKLLPGAHLTFNVQTEKYASNYCKKGEQPKAEWDELEEKGPTFGLNVRMIFEYGVLDHRGLDGKMVSLATALVAGTIDLNGIKKEYPESYVQYHRGYEKLQEDRNQLIWRNWQTTSEWIYGDTGTGKSHRWKSIWDPVTMFRIKTNDKGWNDGYNGQPIIIIDELRPKQIPFSDLLQMLDSGPFDIPNRGKAPQPFLARHVYITSCYHPKDCYGDLDGADSIDQLLDRIGIITHMTGKSKRKRNEIIFLEQVQDKYGVCEEEVHKKDCSEAGSSKEHEAC